MNPLTQTKTRRLLTAGIIGLGILSLVPVAAQAWGRGGRGQPSPERAVERLTEELALTADQQERVKAVLEENFAKREELRQTHRQDMDALREQTHESLAAVLTPEQVQKLDQLREERTERREHRGDGERRPRKWCDEPAATD